MDGVEVIAALRGWSRAPIIVLSGRTSSDDKVEALDVGADDYVTKPFAMDELLARMRAVVRRVTPDDEIAQAVIGECTIDLGAHRATRVHEGASEDVRLTPTEWRVLEVLVRNPGRLITQRQLLTEVWGPAYTRETGYLRLYLAQLRRKLELEPSRPRHLVTEPGIGYRFLP
jgi:two-component system KDP operon response regulator KdpE